MSQKAKQGRKKRTIAVVCTSLRIPEPIYYRVKGLASEPRASLASVYVKALERGVSALEAEKREGSNG